MTKEQIEKYLKKNWLSKDNKELAAHIGKSISQVVRYARKMGLPPKEGGGSNKLVFNKVSVEEMKEKRKKQDIIEIKNKTINQLLKENLAYEKILGIKDNMNEIHVLNIKKSPKVKSEATAVVLASDWHVGEFIDPSTIDGVNSYNEDIVNRRATQFFQHTVRLVEIFKKDIEIKTLILALLGDFISNTIHEDLQETNTMLPALEISLAQDLLVSGIQFILDNTDLDLVIPCHSGNHGRMTKKQRISSEAGNSLEYVMYMNIQKHFKNNPRVKMIVSKGYFSHINVYDRIIRFHHGHNISYGGGVGGVTIPINKAIAQWNKTKNVSIDCFGHFHQFTDGGYWVCNGSMIGFNNYAQSIKATYEEPKQTFFLLDAKRGKTIVAPITFED